MPEANSESNWTPVFSPWRHGGWYVNNVVYPAGYVGCVSNNYADKKWRIACDPRRVEAGGEGDVTFPSRDAAARAERDLAQAEHDRLAPWLASIEDQDTRHSAASMVLGIEQSPHRDVKWHVNSTRVLRPADVNALRAVAEAYLAHLRETAPPTLLLATEDGQTLELRPLPLPRMPSEATSDWRKFLGQPVPGGALPSKAESHLLAFMRRHRTEAVTDGQRMLTAELGKLYLCDPAVLLGERTQVAAPAAAAAPAPERLAELQALGFDSEVEFRDHQLTLQATQALAAEMRAAAGMVTNEDAAMDAPRMRP